MLLKSRLGAFLKPQLRLRLQAPRTDVPAISAAPKCRLKATLHTQRAEPKPEPESPGQGLRKAPCDKFDQSLFRESAFQIAAQHKVDKKTMGMTS